MRIVESEARIVRQIYGMFLDGQTPSSIAAYLTRCGIPTPSGKTRWQDSTVKSILTNEKYKGDALLQKTFTVDFLQKKKKSASQLKGFGALHRFADPDLIPLENQAFDLAMEEKDFSTFDKKLQSRKKS